jgi:hypothetical protein
MTMRKCIPYQVVVSDQEKGVDSGRLVTLTSGPAAYYAKRGKQRSIRLEEKS